MKVLLCYYTHVSSDGEQNNHNVVIKKFGEPGSMYSLVQTADTST